MSLAAKGSVSCYFAREGSSDEGLIRIIETTLYSLGYDDVNVVPLRKKGTVRTLLKEVFSLSPGCSLVFVHRDSDNVDRNERRNEIEQALIGFNLSSNQEIVPIIPVKESESWILHALNDEEYAERVGFSEVLGLPSRKDIPGLRNAKEELERLCAVRDEKLCKGKRRRRGAGFSSHRRNLFESLDEIDYLNDCLSFKEFYLDLSSRLF
ncbi:hypothetical protein [Corynebacterium nasicanis]|uniref:DUF4276 family protein n=1 Tax=Corynebacterium nasicanis TaxID=1448267 RepID=A0ABW1Q907_9CORY